MSPFRSTSDATRTRAALDISLDEVLVEIERLRKLIKVTHTQAEKNRLRAHLRATQNHYQGWADYVGKSCPRVPRATEKPKRSTR